MTRKQDETFRVIDRRLFTAEGELRPEAAENKRAEEKAGERPPGASTIPPPVAGKPTGAERPAGKLPKRSVSFERLLESLANNAALYLGAVPDPRSGQPMLDLEAAREMIDILDALREKTEGNLAPEEEQLLSELLGNLKLTFLELSKTASKAMRERAQGKT